MAAGQARLQQRRQPGQLAQRLAVPGAHRVGHRQAGAVQHVEQGDEEAQVLPRATLDQGQYVFAVLQTDEEVAVLRAGGDALELQQAAEPVGGEEGFQFVALQRGKNGHGVSCS
ncbi:hypothetical protein D3C71_1754790 [compost metagenome]